MKIDYLFSRNKKIGSRAISWAASFEKTDLEVNPSHVAVLLNDQWVIESTFTTGVRIVPYQNWLKINEELYKIPCEQNERPSWEVTDKAIHLWGKGYDWKGILYFSWVYAKLILFNKPLPKNNPWQRKYKYFCTEYVGLLVGEDYSMKSPARLCAEWLGVYNG